MPVKRALVESTPMARKLLRLALLLAIAFAVPLQGFAAASAGVCMSLGHHQAGDARDGHGHGSQAGPGYPVNDAAAGDLHCPPCVSCCAAAAIAPAFEPALPQVVAAVPEASVQQSFAAGVPERLDRPPLAL
jgi:hypothetical protein